jgi:protein involved in polysaccharide export with SLBB domain
MGLIRSIQYSTLTLLLCARLAAQEAAPLAAAVTQATNGGYFYVSSPDQLAPWQQRLTFGPSDVLSISIYEQPDSAKPNVVIGPDGRLNYLQARDVLASGLTVDELRESLQKELLKFYRPPLRVIVIPQTYNSKKYFMLGNVVQKGVFRLDTPVTLLEAIAKAQGFVNAVPGDNTTMLVDLGRSFIMRREPGPEPSADRTNLFSRLPVDFEGLFTRGELSQNVALAPDDYVFLPPAALQEIYVLGEVVGRGATPFRTGLTVIGAIASRGGFTDRAFRKRVLIVRGSLSNPNTFVVDVSDMLVAKALDFRLEARDIVYVSRKPWYKVEELIEAAISDFLRAAAITYAGEHVGPFITDPVIK